MDVNIIIQNISGNSTVPTEKQLQQWAKLALCNVDKSTELTLRIVDEEEGRMLNNTWRNKDYATNVLSFPIGETLEGDMELLGDVVICAPVVEREASEQGKPTDAHWAHLVVHGILHLRGYDHENDDEAGEMEQMEITLLDKIGYPNPYETELES
ncbi:MAG: rRNA maturation RNase YbeY [Gammaproteobacteria bacterium]